MTPWDWVFPALPAHSVKEWPYKPLPDYSPIVFPDGSYVLHKNHHLGLDPLGRTFPIKPIRGSANNFLFPIGDGRVEFLSFSSGGIDYANINITWPIDAPEKFLLFDGRKECPIDFSDLPYTQREVVAAKPLYASLNRAVFGIITYASSKVYAMYPTSYVGLLDVSRNPGTGELSCVVKKETLASVSSTPATLPVFEPYAVDEVLVLDNETKTVWWVYYSKRVIDPGTPPSGGSVKREVFGLGSDGSVLALRITSTGKYEPYSHVIVSPIGVGVKVAIKETSSLDDVPSPPDIPDESYLIEKVTQYVTYELVGNNGKVFCSFQTVESHETHLLHRNNQVIYQKTDVGMGVGDASFTVDGYASIFIGMPVPMSGGFVFDLKAYYVITTSTTPARMVKIIRVMMTENGLRYSKASDFSADVVEVFSFFDFDADGNPIDYRPEWRTTYNPVTGKFYDTAMDLR